MTAITQIIRDINATGAQFVINAHGGVGLDRAIPVDLLSVAKQHKDGIREELIRLEGIRRLGVAAEGLPLDFADLQAFFFEDLPDFGSGAVSMEGIRHACEWFAYTYKGRAQA
ncbi:MAG: hypothetical protein PHE17_09060 [Thiothrix sp.]|uniref:hypothetical protein n=1 Tax=Thiothrix sp. TaxID=1032 RepID=UPI002636B3B4|nr:hypothetical protein [Thiothrix sp.]MDD5393153.1 hypothetical protein [Thiothrix sp.]